MAACTYRAASLHLFDALFCHVLSTHARVRLVLCAALCEGGSPSAAACWACMLLARSPLARTPAAWPPQGMAPGWCVVSCLHSKAGLLGNERSLFLA